MFNSIHNINVLDHTEDVVHKLNIVFVVSQLLRYLRTLIENKHYQIGNSIPNQDNYKTDQNFNIARNINMIYLTMQTVPINKIIKLIFVVRSRDGFVYIRLCLTWTNSRFLSLSWRHRAQRLAGSMSLSCAHAAAGSVRVWKSNAFRANCYWPVIFRFDFWNFLDEVKCWQGAVYGDRCLDAMFSVV